ncbi:MAG TPA: allophanate hydrolase [Lacunisphaera sp.]
MPRPLSLDLNSLRAAYAAGTLTPTQLVDEVLHRLDTYGDKAVWIHRLSREELLAHARRVEARGPTAQPLYGVPFAIKDNIDLAGVPTTAACPEFAYTPAASATVVQRLLDAGAIPIGKTNLDQFATGLVGVRSPYGVPRNPFHPDMIPGGSSSGSACAVAAGLVSFSLGTDTAGSGRVPASFQNLVGVKPTRGWFSTNGVVPACRSLDCPSVFALTVSDATAVTQIAAGYDAADPFSRPAPSACRSLLAGDAFRFGVPAAGQLEWFGDAQNPALFADAVRRLESLGGTRVEIDFTPFRDAARLLYEGPWVAERWSAVRAFHAKNANALFPVTRKIIEGGATPLAVDAFEALYKLAALRRQADTTWEKIDTLVLPTAASIYTRAQLEAEPIKLNSQLGHYTNFANLLDTAAIAVPAGFRPDGLPFGITLFGPAWTDAKLSALGDAFADTTTRPLGATGIVSPVGGVPPPRAFAPTAPVRVLLAVVGAHLRGQPLNHQLTSRHAEFIRATHTADCYQLFALAGTKPPKPGLRRATSGPAGKIEVEVWSLTPEAFGSFTAEVPAPLAIGTVQLADGTSVKGFVCEPEGFAGARDITAFGGWRAYLASLG